MKRKNINSKEGFTIIEVVLVLAIAGLIFLMVFIALPALQRSQRDTQRRDDMARFLSQLNQYQANNGGRVPEGVDGYNKETTSGSGSSTTKTRTGLIPEYLEAGGDTFNDPSTGSPYQVMAVNPCPTSGDCGNKSRTDSEMGHIYVYTNAKCEGENPVYIQGNRKIAITLKLEGAGIYCGNS